MTGKVWFSTAETAAALGYSSRSTVVDMIHAGEIKAHRRGHIYRVPKAELDRLASAPIAGAA